MYRSIKVLMLVFFVAVLTLLIFIDKLFLSPSFKSFNEIKKTREENTKLINNLKINNIDCIYDKNSNIFYYNISDKYNNSKYVMNLNLDNYKYIILNYKTNTIKVDYNKPIDVVIYNNKYYFKTRIIITNLPLISISTEREISSEEVNSKFEYINSSDKKNTIEKNSKIHIRGASSKAFDKKSYRLRFYDKNYENEVKSKIKGFYDDKSLLLISPYRDPSKIRNDLATHLWNDMSNDFKKHDINSKYVELFINNEYQGLYLLMEPVNRSKLNLDKKNGIVIKTISWDVLDINDDFDNIDSRIYSGYEIKYPNSDETLNKIWSIFLNKISDYYNKDIDNNYSVVSKTFNLENYIDMIIFNSFINNIDSNMIKNLYFYMNDYDGLIYIEPWDLEFSFGYIFDVNSKNYGKVVDDSGNIRIPIFSSDKELNKLIIKRYKVLRASILTTEYFDKLLDEYLNNLIYASKRDSERWKLYNLNHEIKILRNWIHKRISVMDEEVNKHE